jgi:hypothetical protein
MLSMLSSLVGTHDKTKSIVLQLITSTRRIENPAANRCLNLMDHYCDNAGCNNGCRRLPATLPEAERGFVIIHGSNTLHACRTPHGKTREQYELTDNKTNTQSTNMYTQE